jgi:hypothetical protein
MPAGHVPEPHATPDGPLSAEASIEQLTDGDVGGHTHQPAGHSAGIGFPQPSMQFKAASGLQPGRSVAASCTPVCPPHAPKATKVTAPTTDADFECGIALPYHCRNAFRGPRPLRTVRSRGRRETRNPFRPPTSAPNSRRGTFSSSAGRRHRGRPRPLCRRGGRRRRGRAFIIVAQGDVGSFAVELVVPFAI